MFVTCTRGKGAGNMLHTPRVLVTCSRFASLLIPHIPSKEWTDVSFVELLAYFFADLSPCSSCTCLLSSCLSLLNEISYLFPALVMLPLLDFLDLLAHSRCLNQCSLNLIACAINVFCFLPSPAMLFPTILEEFAICRRVQCIP